MKNSPAVKYATIQASGDQLIVNSVRRLIGGGHLDFCDSVSFKSTDLSNVGRGVREALEKYRVDEPRPNWLEIKCQYEANVASAAGVDSYRILIRRGIKSVNIKWTLGTIYLDPLKHEKSGSFVGVDGVNPVIVPDTISDQELGEAVVQALQRAI